MTSLYISDCTPLCDPLIIERLLPRFDTKRQEKIRSLCVLKKQAQSAAAGLLQNHLFGNDASYDYTDLGKPFLTDHRAHFSIAHSGKWVGIAVSDRNIGMDIQTLSPIRPKVFQRAFTADEQRYIGTDISRFTELWTRKEAYAKYTGQGMAKQFASPLPDIPYFTDCFTNTIYTVCGDDSVRVIHINLKDLL